MSKTLRGFFWLAAGVFFVWQNVAMYLWLRQNQGVGPGLGHMWSALTTDWLLLLILTDACMFSALALGWFYTDMRQRGIPSPRRHGLLIAAIALGSPVLLIYLANRKP